MAEENNTSARKSFENLYQGSGEFLQTNYGAVPTATHAGGLTGFSLQGASQGLGFPGLPTTANQLGQAMEVIKSGVKSFEVTTLGLQGEDIVPKEHFNEMRALMKLSGVKPSMHGPLIDPAGFGERGWSGEQGRAAHERRIWDAVEKAHMLEPDGNVPIVFHASNAIGGREYVKIKNEEGEWEKRLQKSTAINRETGQLVPIEYQEKYSPTLGSEGLQKGGRPDYILDQYDEKGKIKQYGAIKSLNETEWDNKMTELATFNKQAQEVMGTGIVHFKGEAQNYQVDRKTRKIYNEQGEEVQLTKEQAEGYQQMNKAEVFLDNVRQNFGTAFHKAYKYGSEEQKEELKELADEYKKNLKSLDENGKMYLTAPERKYQIYQGAINKLQNITGGHNAPELYQEVEDFATDKAADTFGNIALKAYDQWGENAPLLVIENLPEHMAFNDPKTFRKVIEESRDAFVNKLQEEKGLSEERAKKVAEKFIGATWDVGHINTLKKRGFTDEDIMEATEHVTEDPTLVKHVHLTDNFGFSDSHMAPGQGNVPIQGILGKLAERTGKLDEMRKIIESGAFISQFRSSPLPSTLTALNSPIYGMKAGPTWNNVQGINGSYNSGFGTTNPSNHHNLYGAGFTTLPTEFGGQVGNDFSRFSGAPVQ